MPYVDLAGGRFFYEVAGNGPDVVFSHGFLMDREMFAPQVEALNESYRCVTWDQRGHGDTSGTSEWTYWDSAGDLLGLLDHLGIESAFLIGMSQGGFVHLRTTLTAPERVRGLVLIDSQAGLENPDHAAAYGAMVEAWTTQGPSDDLAQAAASILLGEGPDHAPWMTKWKERAPAELKPIYNTLTSRDDITERLGEIEAPALVIHGELDVAIPLERAQALCDGLTNCDGLVTVPGAGHAANLGAPETVTEAIGSFLGKHA